MSTDQVKKSQSDRTEEALAALRKTALEMLVNEGINGLKLSEVGVKAGYSRGIVNYHFGTKNDLLTDLLDNAAKTSEILNSQANGSGLTKLENMLDELIRMATEETQETTGLLLLVNEATSTSDKKLKKRLAEYNRRVRQNLALTIEEERHSSPLSNKTDIELAVLILALVRGVFSQWFAEPDTFDIIQALKNIKASLPALLRM